MQGNPLHTTIEDGTSVWFCVAECNSGGYFLDFVTKMEETDIHVSAFRLHEWCNLSPSLKTNGEKKTAKEGKGYLRDLDKELRALLAEGDDDATVRFVKEKVLESYRNGRADKKQSAQSADSSKRPVSPRGGRFYCLADRLSQERLVGG